MPHLSINSEQKPVLIRKVLTESGHYPVHSTSLIQISQREPLRFHLASLSALRNSYPLPAAAFRFISFSEETGAEAPQSSDPPWLSPVTLSSPSVSAEISPQNKRQKTIPEMTRTFWVLWSWEVCLLVWSPACWAETLNWTRTPSWQLHVGSPSSQVLCLAECPAEAHFFPEVWAAFWSRRSFQFSESSETLNCVIPEAGSLQATPAALPPFSRIPATKARDGDCLNLM